MVSKINMIKHEKCALGKKRAKKPAQGKVYKNGRTPSHPKVYMFEKINLHPRDTRRTRRWILSQDSSSFRCSGNNGSGCGHGYRNAAARGEVRGDVVVVHVGAAAGFRFVACT